MQTRNRPTTLLVVLSCVVLVLALGGSPRRLVAQKPEARAFAHQPGTLSIFGNPLTIQVGSNASIQVYYQGYDRGQVYGDADSGIFFWVDDEIYGSNLEGTNVGTHYSSAAMFTLDLITLSHRGPSGSGSASDPWKISTVMNVGATGLGVTQQVSYVQGQSYFRLTWYIENHSPSSMSFDLFHAADVYFAGSDWGYGYYDPIDGAVGGYNLAQDWYMTFFPLTPPTHYQAAEYLEIWRAIGNCDEGPCSQGPGFNDTIDTRLLDNGIGLQWRVMLRTGEATEISDYWTFGPMPLTPSPTITPTPTGLPRCVRWDTVWHDQFDDPALPFWQADLAEGSGLVQDSILHLRSKADKTDRFPLLWSQVPFPEQGYTLEIRFRYGIPTNYGTTIGIGSAAYAGIRFDEAESPPPGIEDVLRIHQLDGYFVVSLFDEVTWQGTSPDTAWHVARVECEGNRYMLGVDGLNIGTTVRQESLPRSIFLGNPAIQHHQGSWTPLDIDYVRVTACGAWGSDYVHLPLLVR